MILLLRLKFYQPRLQKLHTIFILLDIQIQGKIMHLNNERFQQISISEQASIRSAQLREQREMNNKVNNEQIQTIKEEIHISSITGIGGSVNITA